MVLGAIVAFMIDKKFLWAAGYCLAGAGLSFIGLIHGEQVQWAAQPQVALGYLFMAVVCALFTLGAQDEKMLAEVSPPVEPAAVPAAVAESR
jgi:AGZA family xanthine/uracil permease-like MFS transporter